MALGRRVSRLLHRTALDAESYHAFAIGERVITKEGVPGVVEDIFDGPFPGTEAYRVVLDAGLGGGEYGVDELWKQPSGTTASAVAQQASRFVDADLNGTAAIDYPELAEILVERPPLQHAVVGSKAPTAPEGWDGAAPEVCNHFEEKENEPGTCKNCWWSYGAHDAKAGGPSGVGRLAAVVAKDYEGQTGNRDHVTRREDGTLPTSAIAHLMGVKGEKPGEHRNRQGEAWESFKDDIRTNGIKSAIFITVDYNDEPRISEGNHRRDAAVELGLEEVPVEIRYFGKAEEQGTVASRAGVTASKTAGWQVVDETGSIHAGPFPNWYQAEDAKNEMLDDPAAHEHVLFVSRTSDQMGNEMPFTGGVLDKTIDWAADRMKVTPGHNWSYDWCRFRKNQRCMYPKSLDAEGTKEAGYAVWVPEDRGFCPRQSWDDQRACPVGEPGPHSGDPDARTDATVSWQEGGQRVSIKTAGRFHCPGSNGEPMPHNTEHFSYSEDYPVTTWSHGSGGGSTSMHHPATHGVCPVCHEPKKKLKDGTLSKHTRYLSWKTQQEMKERGEDPNNPKTSATVIWPNEPVEEQGFPCAYCLGEGYGGVLAVGRAQGMCGKCMGRGFIDIKFKTGSKTVTFTESGLYEMLGELALPPYDDGQGGYLGTDVDCAPIASHIIDKVEQTRIAARHDDDDLAIGYVECSECGHPIENHSTNGCHELGGECPCKESWTRAEVAAERKRSGLPVRWKQSSLDDHEWLFHVTARWTDVRDKASRIRKAGHIRIIAATEGYVTAEVRGDTNVYQTTIMRLPGKKSAAMWECGCAWANYSWARSGRWKKYEGRMCAHALALVFEAQAREMFGGTITEDAGKPQWRSDPTIPVVRPGDYRTKPTPWRVGSKTAGFLVEDEVREIGRQYLAEHPEIAALAEQYEASRPVEALVWDGWNIMEQSGSSGFGYQMTLGFNLPAMGDGDQWAYELQDRLREAAQSFGAREVSTEVRGVAPLEIDRRGEEEITPHVISTDASLHASLYETMFKDAGFGGVLKAKVRGVVRRVLDLLPGGQVQVDGVGAVPAREVLYPKYDPRAGLDPRDLKHGSLKIIAVGADTSGVMVCLIPPKELCERLLKEAADLNPDEKVEKLDNAHITLAYLGDQQSNDRERLEHVVSAFAYRASKLTGRLSGFGVFHNENNVAVALWDIPGLEKWREDLVDTLNASGFEVASNHGYTPHMTLLYAGGSTTPKVPGANALDPKHYSEITFDSFTLSYGTDWLTYPMGGTKDGQPEQGERKAASWGETALACDVCGDAALYLAGDEPLCLEHINRANGRPIRTINPREHHEHADPELDMLMAARVAAWRTGGFEPWMAQVPDSTTHTPEDGTEWAEDHPEEARALLESTLHDQPEPALPTTDGADEDADEDPEAIHQAFVSGGVAAPTATAVHEVQQGDLRSIIDTDGDLIIHREESRESRDFPRESAPMRAYEGSHTTASGSTPLGVPADVQQPAWLAPGGGNGGAARVAQSRAANAEIAGMAKLYLEGGQEAITVVAMKNYSPAEQAEIINEGDGQRAANLDRLDLTGTHYPALMTEDDDEETWLS